MQDHSDLAGQGNFSALHAAPLGDIHAPALKRREAGDSGQQNVSCLVEDGANHRIADPRYSPCHICLP